MKNRSRAGAALLVVGLLGLALAGCGDDGGGGGDDLRAADDDTTDESTDDESTDDESTDDEATDDEATESVDPESVDVCGLLSDEEVESLMGAEPFDEGLASEGENYEGEFICEWSTDPNERSDLRGVIVHVGLLEDFLASGAGYDDLQQALEEGTNSAVEPIDDVGDEAFYVSHAIGSFSVALVEGDTLFELSVVNVTPPDPGSSEYDELVELAAELPGRA